MKILSFAWLSPVSPVGHVNRFFLSALARRGHEIKVISPDYPLANKENFPFEVIAVRGKWPYSDSWEDRLSVRFGYEFVDSAYRFFARRAAKTLLREWSPDIVYSRSSPISTVWVASDIVSYHGFPHICFFTDPLPAPLSIGEKKRNFLHLFRSKKMGQILPKLDAYSFLCKQMADWVHQNSDISDTSRVFYMPNPIPEQYDFQRASAPVFSYIGNFYANRKADTLIAGFALLLKDVPSAELWLIGTQTKNILPLLTTRELKNQVKLLPYTQDVISPMKQSRALIDVDCNSPENVFISTKIMEYLGTPLPIVLITTPDSPSEQILRKLPSNARFVYHGDISGTASALKWALDMDVSDVVMSERAVVTEPLNMKNQISQLEQKMAALISSKR